MQKETPAPVKSPTKQLRPGRKVSGCLRIIKLQALKRNYQAAIARVCSHGAAHFAYNHVLGMVIFF